LRDVARYIPHGRAYQSPGNQPRHRPGGRALLGGGSGGRMRLGPLETLGHHLGRGASLLQLIEGSLAIREPLRHLDRAPGPLIRQQVPGATAAGTGVESLLALGHAPDYGLLLARPRPRIDFTVPTTGDEAQHPEGIVTRQPFRLVHGLALPVSPAPP